VDLTHSRISKIENLEVLFQVEVRNVGANYIKVVEGTPIMSATNVA